MATAVEAVERMSFGELVELAVLVGMLDVGPWVPHAAKTAAAGYRHAHARAPIAEALDDRFATALHLPIARHAQQGWTTADLPVDRLAPLFRDYEQVYGAGQFSWAGLWDGDGSARRGAWATGRWSTHAKPRRTRSHGSFPDANNGDRSSRR